MTTIRTKKSLAARHGMRIVAGLAMLAIMLGVRCSRSVGIDAVVAPPGAADVAAWWRLERHRAATTLDHANFDRLAAATQAGRESWRRWLDGRWRRFIEEGESQAEVRLPEIADPEPGDEGGWSDLALILAAEQGVETTPAERLSHWRSRALKADRLRLEADEIDATTVARIVDALGLDAEASGRFERWWRLEKARRLAGGFAPRGGTPASPEAIVAADLGSLDSEVAQAVLEVLDRTSTDRSIAIEHWARARRELSWFEGECNLRPWQVDPEQGSDLQRAARGFNDQLDAAVVAFDVTRGKVIAGTAGVLVEAAGVLETGRTADRWRLLAARLAGNELPSMALHAAMMATARRTAGDDFAAMADIDAADRRFRERIRRIEDQVVRILDTGAAGKLTSVLESVRGEARSAVADRDAVLQPFLDRDQPTLLGENRLEDGWGDWTIEFDAIAPEIQTQFISALRQVIAPPSRSRDGISLPITRLDDPIVSLLVTRHDQAYRETVSDALHALFEEASRIESAVVVDSEPASARRERALRLARERLGQLVAELDTVDAMLAEALVAAMPGELDAAEVDRWLARRMRGRLVVPADLLVAVMRSGGSMVLVGAFASFERASERAGLSDPGVAAAALVEDDLAEDLGAMRHVVIAALLDDLMRLVVDGGNVRDGASSWPHLHRLRDREAAFDRRVRAAVNAGLDGDDAARWLDAWASERNAGLGGWFAIGREAFDGAARLTTGRGDRMAMVLAVEAWIERRASLRDEIDAWWSAEADPPVVGSEADRLELLRRSPEVLAAEADRREIDGRLALAAVAVLGPEVLDDPFVSRLIASPTPIGLRLAAGPDESMDADDLLDLDAEEPVTLRP